jgi:hypothetical protein
MSSRKETSAMAPELEVGSFLRLFISIVFIIDAEKGERDV